MANIQIAVINESSAVTDAEAKGAIPALQTQVRRDFAPIWGIDADLAFVPKDTPPPAGSWWLVLFDDSDQAGALGYHDLTTQGLPIGKVFAGTDKKLGYQWTVTVSHELLEMLADPDIDLTVFVQSEPSKGILYSYEVCDACEADEFGYKIDGTLVSDFVFPAWFESFRQPNSSQFDFGNQIHKPFDLLQGGYIGVFDVTAGTGWHQMYPPNERLHAGMRPRVGSRRERRRTPRSQWLRSSKHQSRR